MKSVADRGMKSAILGICVNFGLAIIKGTQVYWGIHSRWSRTA
jgi:hypothetical protein